MRFNEHGASSFRFVLAWLVVAGSFAACGGSPGGSGRTLNSGGPAPAASATATAVPTATATATNTVAIDVNLGPEGNYPNGLFTSVTVCVPGTSSCQAIDNVLVDTGSYGLRILGSALKLDLPPQTGASGAAIGECALFAASYTWGPVANADIYLGGEVAHSVPLQIIGESGFAAAPRDCTDSGLAPADTLAALGAYGILGVGPFVQDCGATCTASGATNPLFYFSCPASGCVPAAESLQAQVSNPVAFFATDNNGVALSLPAVSAAGSAAVSGTLLFGIGTQTNNGLGSATVYTADPNYGDFTTVFNGASYPQSFIDSGSNGLYFLSSASSGIAVCGDGESGFYCPPRTLNFTATNVGQNGASGTVAFSIANALELFDQPNVAAFNNLGGVNPGAFDWGLPFFFGRQVFFAIDGATTPGGPGPYYAY